MNARLIPVEEVGTLEEVVLQSAVDALGAEVERFLEAVRYFTEQGCAPTPQPEHLEVRR